MRIGIIGAGNMGQAIVKGLLEKFGSEVSILAYDKSQAALQNLPAVVEVAALRQWAAKKMTPDAILIAVKPQDVTASVEAFASWSPSLRNRPLWISIAAGIPTKVLQDELGSGARICRAMPNTPALIGQGMHAFCMTPECTKMDAELVERILGACGRVVRVTEKLMDAITGLSGSGPAYAFLFMEALTEGGVTAGLPYEVAKECAIQTVLGSAMLAQQSSESLADLRRRVTSPGGTTARGILALEENRFKYAIVKAVADATARSEELGKAAGTATDEPKRKRAVRKG